LRISLQDPYINRQSVVHNLRPIIKFIAALALIITIVILPRTVWLAYGAIGLLLLMLAVLSHLPLIHIFKRLIILEPFVLFVALMSLFQPNGLWIFLSLATKGTLSISTMILLIATTRFSDILRVLWQLRIPTILVTTISLMYRYLFLIFEEMNRMTRARSSRTFSQSKKR
jgi:cobalt/nickel transport system permease protein